MSQRLAEEFRNIEKEFGETQYGPDSEWLIVEHWKLPLGWNKRETRVLLLIPPGYPFTPPDNFYVDDDLRLENDSQPGNASPGQNVAGGTWQQFSFHVEAGDWHPHAETNAGDTLSTFLAGVSRRLSEAN